MSDVEVTLHEITSETVRTICKLEVRPEQRSYVADNAFSIAEAHFEPRAWFRAVYAGDVPVGFVMLDENLEKEEYFLWRFMIAGEHQRKGYGKRALDLVVERMRTLPGACELISSYVPGEHGPRDFYLGYGFAETGEVEAGEHLIRFELVARPRVD